VLVIQTSTLRSGRPVTGIAVVDQLGESDTMLGRLGDRHLDTAYEIPPSTAAHSSPQRNNHDAAFAARAKASGSAISPLLAPGLWRHSGTLAPASLARFV
jgi:hypothetical protein